RLPPKRTTLSPTPFRYPNGSLNGNFLGRTNRGPQPPGSSRSHLPADAPVYGSPRVIATPKSFTPGTAASSRLMLQKPTSFVPSTALQRKPTAQIAPPVYHPAKTRLESPPVYRPVSSSRSAQGKSGPHSGPPQVYRPEHKV